MSDPIKYNRMMRVVFLWVCLMTMGQTIGQIDKMLSGSWVQTAEKRYKGMDKPFLDIDDGIYLRYTFTDNGEVDIATYYAANMDYRRYVVKDSVIQILSDKKFRILKVDESNLIMVELEDGRTTPNSIIHYFIREQAYLDKLPLLEEDIILLGKDTVYMDSEKLHAVFQIVDYPDFHLYLHNKIKTDYRKGENYFQASFVVWPNGKITNIDIFHHIGKASDKKVKKVIKASEGRWKLPLLDAEKVAVLVTIEDRYLMGEKQKSFDFSDLFSPDTFHVYTDNYQKNFNRATRSFLRGNYRESLKYLAQCEQIKPGEPNLSFLRYRCYTKLEDYKNATINFDRLKKSRFNYLVK